jgi:hypothetical protein
MSQHTRKSCHVVSHQTKTRRGMIARIVIVPSTPTGTKTKDTIVLSCVEDCFTFIQLFAALVSPFCNFSPPRVCRLVWLSLQHQQNHASDGIRISVGRGARSLGARQSVIKLPMGETRDCSISTVHCTLTMLTDSTGSCESTHPLPAVVHLIRLLDDCWKICACIGHCR